MINEIETRIEEIKKEIFEKKMQEVIQ